MEVTYSAGTTVVPLTIGIIDDFVAEGTEAFNVTLGLPSGLNANRVLAGLDRSTVFITDNDGE